MTVKQQVTHILEQLPDDCSYEDVQYRLYVVELIRKRQEELDSGAALIPHDDVRREFAKWLKT